MYIFIQVHVLRVFVIRCQKFKKQKKKMIFILFATWNKY